MRIIEMFSCLYELGIIYSDGEYVPKVNDEESNLLILWKFFSQLKYDCLLCLRIMIC